MAKCHLLQHVRNSALHTAHVDTSDPPEYTHSEHFRFFFPDSIERHAFRAENLRLGCLVEDRLCIGPWAFITGGEWPPAASGAAS